MSDVEGLTAARPVRAALVLLGAAILALVLANSSFGPQYTEFWRTVYLLPGGVAVTAQAVVDKGLMTFFFLAVGLELKRELTHGALRHPKAMALPFVSAVGGMVAPALLYYSVNHGGHAVQGWAIPMSTDIAFAVGALALLGRRVPRNLMIFLLALAIVDDLGAILIIAFYYTRTPRLIPLLAALGLVGALVFLNRRQVRGLGPFLALGTLLWLALGLAGVDPPLAGVLVAASIPASGPARQSGAPPFVLAKRLERWLAPPITFGIMPLFALANAGLAISIQALTAKAAITVGIFLGLLFGKFLGIAGAAWLALRVRLARLPTGVSYRHILGVAWLGGIGFTMALFLNTLAFASGADRVAGKVGILAASPLAAALGAIWLFWSPPERLSLPKKSGAHRSGRLRTRPKGPHPKP